jgi:hypothetical protein
MSQSGSGNLDPVLEGVEVPFHQKGGSASFGAKMVLSLNGVDPGCMNSIIGPTCRAKCSNILHDKTRNTVLQISKHCSSTGARNALAYFPRVFISTT